VDGETLAVRLAGETARLNFTQLGMANAKNGRPTLQWELLRQFAAGQGVFDWSSRSAHRLQRKRKQLLSQRLRAFFRIEGDPFELSGNGWRTRFAIDPD
jgi:hypothetical protein